MEIMIKKYKLTSGNIYLVENEFIDNNGILIGNAIRLTKKIGEDFCFLEELKLFSEKDIINTAIPPENEILFFEYVRRMKELSIRKFILEDFDVYKYVNLS